jgi:cytoskeletal protein RodZ
MSLINDALKRAQQTQEQNPPPTPSLEFRPAEANSRPARRSTLMFVALALVVVLLLGLTGTLIWYVSQARAADLRVAARTAETPPSPPPVVAAPPVVPAPAVAPPTPPQFEHPEEPNTNRVPVSADAGEVVQPTALKLQGIAFDPQKPSAIVNGRSLYLGDRVEKFRLVAISPVAVTLVSDTETNVLSLSH